MKNACLIFFSLLLSCSVFAQKLISVENDIFYQDQFFQSNILGYKTHFDTDSNLVMFSNATDTVMFWVGPAANESTLYLSPTVFFPSSGFYNLTLFNNVDDTMKLPQALFVLPAKNNPIHLYHGQPYFTQAGGQHLMIFNGSGFPHFNSCLLSYAYFFRGEDQILVDSIIAYNDQFLHVYFTLDSTDIGLYNFLYFNDVDSFLFVKNALWIQSDLKTCIREVMPDSMTNLDWQPDTVYVKGNRTHFLSDTNYIGFSDDIILTYGYIENLMVLNDSLLKFELFLPMPVKIALYPNTFLWVFNPSDGLMFYPLLIELYGAITVPQELLAEIECFPNPANETIKLTINPALEKELMLDIYDITGHLVMKKQLSAFTIESSIDVRHLKSGVYLLKLMSENQVVYRGRMVKE
ncbi:MAG: T9SS type A sorting domain-containing protein [Bacteroidales bacterium]|nr:T9SS type A sorting domain-containing protein [Bacteroidales bacterium]